MHLAIFDENGVRRPISIWAPLLFATYDHYAFLECLTLILQDFNEDGKLYRLSAEQIGWMHSFCPPCDWFLEEDFTFIRLCGFTEEPF